MLGLESSNKTLGHRFLSGGAIALKHADDYERALREHGQGDRRLRRAPGRNREAARKDAPAAQMLVADDALLDEITALVEAPAVYAGKFERRLPRRCRRNA